MAQPSEPKQPAHHMALGTPVLSSGELHPPEGAGSPCAHLLIPRTKATTGSREPTKLFLSPGQVVAEPASHCWEAEQATWG